MMHSITVTEQEIIGSPDVEYTADCVCGWESRTFRSADYPAGTWGSGRVSPAGVARDNAHAEGLLHVAMVPVGAE